MKCGMAITCLSVYEYEINNKHGMNKYELACQVAKASGKTLKEVIPIINSLFKVMGETILAGVKINIGDLGSFSLKVRKQRKGYDPYHRVPMIIPESMSLKFEAAPSLQKKIAIKCSQNIISEK